MRHADASVSACLLSMLQEMGTVIDVNLARAEGLRQSILKHAFVGKLVPQDSGGEPTRA